jgi:uncharacterized Zn-binding protein involved in type VI secretion
MVLIGGKPAAVVGDNHVCPLVNPGVPPPPHVGGPIMPPGVPTVLIGGKPAACVGDMVTCSGPPDSILPPGCPTVLIGSGGGGGGGGGSGSKAKAKVEKAEAKIGENHYLDISFEDKGGKPITGVKYTIKDPDGKESEGVLVGRVKKSGLKEGSYDISLTAIVNAEWSTNKAKAGETVKLKAETAGIRDGEKASFHIHIRDSNYADRQLTTVKGEVSGDKAEVEWQLEVDEDLLEIQTDKERVGRFSAPVYYFTVEAGGFQSRSPFLDIVDKMEVSIVDEDGNPVRNKDYRLFLASGEVRTGTLDSDGKVKLDDVPPGRVRISVDVRE